MRTLVEIKAKLALYANTALPLAGCVGESDANDFFLSETFKDHLKHQEFKEQARSAIFDRFDKVLIGMGRLGKVFARRR